jgi:hydrogenase/urease accessory protein HupE
VALGAALLAGLLPAAARGHGSSLSYLELNVRGERVIGALDVPSPELARGLYLDADGDGALGTADLLRGQAVLAKWLLGTVRLVADGQPCEGVGGVPEMQADGLAVVRGTWTCAGPISELVVSTRFAETFGSGHATFARVARGDQARQGLFDDATTELHFSFAAPGAWREAAARYLVLGVEHIFTGLDHVLFLLSLVLLGGTLRRVVAVATAFTLAHSLTLTAAALGWASPPSRWVESAIALSIAWVAIENLVLARPAAPGSPEPLALRLRWALTFAFGLVHGFGFAGVLGELGLPQGHQALAIAAFNAGVEVGQVVILATGWPLLAWAQRRAWYRPAAVRFASVGVLSIALYWFTERAFLP